MKVLRRLLNVLITVVCIVTMTSTAFAAQFSDVPDGSQYSEAVTSLVSLGLIKGYEDGTFRPDSTITRAEFAAVMTRAMGMESIVDSMTSGDIFSDMVINGENHWATGYVRVAYNLNIIKGMGDGTFAPDDPVTFEQAVKMIVCALGYEMLAEDSGSWPAGYVKVANDLNITGQGANMSPTNQPAPRGIVAKLLYNALEVPLMESTSGGTMAQSSKTILNDKLKVYRLYNRMVTEVDGTLSINPGESTLREGEVMLESGTDKEVFIYTDAIDSLSLKNLVGHYVSGYYRDTADDEGRNTLVTLDTSASRSREVTIDSSDISEYDGRNLVYWYDSENSNRTDDIVISANAKFIYNGVAYDYLSSSSDEEQDLSYWLDPNSTGFVDGEIRFLDSDGDNSYDSLFVEDFETYVVKAPVKTNDPLAANNYVIYDYYIPGKSIQIDPYDSNVHVEVYNAKTMVEMTMESLRTLNVVSIAASMDNKNFTCYVSTDAVTGTVTEVSGDGSYYQVGSKLYEVTNEFKQAMDLGKVSMEMDSRGTFYLDRRGRIAAVNLTPVQTGNYGYITAAGTTSPTDDTARIKIMALTGTPSTPTIYKVASRVSINRKTYTSTDSVLDALERSASVLTSNNTEGVSGATHSQLVKFVKNADDEITSITTVSLNSDGRPDVSTNTDSGYLKIGQTLKDYTYNSASGFANQIFINASTKIMIVPEARNDDAGYKRAAGMSYFKTGNQYTIEAYDVNPSGIASVIVVYGDEASVSINSDTEVSLIRNISVKVSDITDSPVYKIEAYENGVLNTYETEDDSSYFGELNIGDAVRFGFNGSGQINEYRKELDIDNRVPQSKHDTTIYEGDYKFKTIYGTVDAISSEMIMIAPAYVDTSTVPATLENENREGYRLQGTTHVYQVDLTGSTPMVTEGDVNTISEFGEMANASASKVFGYAYNNNLKMLIVYID